MSTFRLFHMLLGNVRALGIGLCALGARAAVAAQASGLRGDLICQKPQASIFFDPWDDECLGPMSLRFVTVAAVSLTAMDALWRRRLKSLSLLGATLQPFAATSSCSTKLQGTRQLDVCWTKMSDVDGGL